jgi:hypothetical protein
MMLQPQFPSAHGQPPIPAAPAVYIKDRALVVPRNFDLPPVCVFTGRTENLVPVKRQLSWHHPAVYFALLANIIIYLILAIVLRKVSTHTYYIEMEERSRRRRWHLINWGILLAGFGLIVAAGVADMPALLLGTLACIVATIVFYFLKVRLLYAQKVTDTEAELRGIAPEAMEKIALLYAP